MPRYNANPIVRPADLRGRSIPSYATEAVRKGTARLVGFESQGDALGLLEPRERNLAAYVPKDRIEPARRWVSLADDPGGVAYLDEEGAHHSTEALAGEAARRSTDDDGPVGPARRAALASGREYLRDAGSAYVLCGVAVIGIFGPLIAYPSWLEDLCGITSYESIKADLKATVAHRAVNAVLFELDSPDGQVTGCSEAALAIWQMREIMPTVAYVPGDACSKGLWLASGAEHIAIAKTLKRPRGAGKAGRTRRQGCAVGPELVPRSMREWLLNRAQHAGAELLGRYAALHGAMTQSRVRAQHDEPGWPGQA